MDEKNKQETNTTEDGVSKEAGGVTPTRSVNAEPHAQVSPRSEGEMKNDIQKILSEVKLQERSASSSSSGKRLTFDTKAASALSDGDILEGTPDSKDSVLQKPTTPPVLPTESIPPAPSTPSTPQPRPQPPSAPIIPPTTQQPPLTTPTKPPLTATTPPPTVLQPSPSEITLPNKEESVQKNPVPPAASQMERTEAPSPAGKAAISSLRTLKEDLQDIVREKKVSLVRAVALEEEKKHKRDEVMATAPIHSGRSQKTLLVALAFVFLGALALLGVYVVMRSQATRSEPLQGAIIFAEQTMSLPLGDEPTGEVKRNVAALRSFSQLTLGAITRVVPVVTVEKDGISEKRPATFTEFMNILGISAPNDLTRALSDEFFFGIHVVDENAPVLVVPVESYERAFAAMLGWEKDINANLAPIFTPVSPFVYDEKGLLIQRPFEDLIIRNYDIRALRDDTGTIQLYYSFPTRNILVIAESTYSFTEILSRLRAERRL